MAGPESIARPESVAGPSSLPQDEYQLAQNHLTITEIADNDDDANVTNNDTADTLMPPVEDFETTQIDEISTDGKDFGQVDNSNEIQKTANSETAEATKDGDKNEMER